MKATRTVARRSAKLVRAIGPVLVALGVVGCGALVGVVDPPTSSGDDDGGQSGGAREGGARDDAHAPYDAHVPYDGHDGGMAHGDAGTTDAATPCGNGVLTAGEACDDGNGSNGDGCSSKCQIEPGWTCAGTPSVCATICGDGIVTGNETCDDESSCPGTCRRTLWSKRYGDAAYQQVSGLAVDPAGAAVITGFYSGKMDFGGGPLSSTGISDVFVAKVDAGGNHVWSRRFGGTGDDRAWAVATDPAGNVVVVGFFSNAIDFGGGPLVSSGSWDVFVAKLDASGNHLWSKRFGDSAQQQGHAVAIDAVGNVVVGGMFWGALDFGGGAMTAVNIDGFVAKLDANGNHIWSRRLGNTGGQNTRGVAVRASGDVFVTGTCRETIDFGGGPLAKIGAEDAFLLALGADGQHRWSKRWGTGNNYHGGASVTVDPAGDVVVAGYSLGSTDLGTGVLPSKGAYDVVVGKFAPTGGPIFVRRFGSVNNDFPSSVATDASKNILLTGYYEGPIDFGNGPLPHAGARNTFVAKLDPSGAPRWSKGHGGSATGMGIAADATGNLLATGYFSGSINLGGAVLASVGGGNNVFLAKLTP